MDCIVNVTQAWGIGLGGQLLVSIPADLKRFRGLTLGKTVVLGRKTLATFPGGRPLKGRRNLVLTRDRHFAAAGAEAVHSERELLGALRAIPADEICVIGGESVYRLLLPYCQRVLLTRTFGDYAADRFFPNLDADANWDLTEDGPLQQDGGVRFQYCTYRNRAPLPLPEVTP